LRVLAALIACISRLSSCNKVGVNYGIIKEINF
jgi:hypothetical protein